MKNKKPFCPYAEECQYYKKNSFTCNEECDLSSCGKYNEFCDEKDNFKQIGFFSQFKKWIVGLFIGSAVLAGGLTMLPEQSIDTNLGTTSTTEKVKNVGIEKVLKDKTQKEKAKIKSKELTKVKIDKFIKDDLRIKIIGDIKEIEVNGQHGIELFAKAWKNGKQLGFGKDGTVEIERFRIFNPPVLVDDVDGEIIREWEEEDLETKEKTKKQRKLKYDPGEAIKQDLIHTIGLVGKNGKNIAKGKIGNTTSTFYSSAGDGRVQSVSGNWNTAHDGTTGSAATAGSSWFGVLSYSDGNYYISRAFFPFDTSAIDDGDTINSANFSFYSSGELNDDENDGDDWISVIQTDQPSDTSLTTADYNNCGAIDNPDEAVDSSERLDLTSASSETRFDFDFNTTGKNWINKTGYTKLGMREGHDIIDSAVTTGGATKKSNIGFYGSDETGTSKDPKLVVEHSEVAATFIPQILIY